MELEGKVIEVTQENIDKGIPSSTTHCPIALSLNSLGIVNANVFPNGIFIVYKVSDNCHRCAFIRHTEETKTFIVLFDSRNKVSPFSFTLNIERHLY